MSFIHPFEGYLVAAERVDAVVAPLPETLTPAERRRYADTHPENYLNAMRCADEFALESAPSQEAFLERNARFVRRCIDERVFVAQPPCVFVYQLVCRDRVQRGIVAEIPVSAYLNGRIKRHELTHIPREDALADYIEHVRVVSNPVCLAYRADDAIRERLDATTRSRPDISHTSADGVAHNIWKLDGADAASLISAFDNVSSVYITDGHHRCAATARFSTTGAGTRLLAVLFPDNEVHILPYHRTVRDFGPHRDLASFLARLTEDFVVEPLPDGEPAAARPRTRGEFAVHAEGRWYRFWLAAPVAAPANSAQRLDATILQTHVLWPILGITTPRDDERLGYVTGADGLETLERACRDRWRIAFALHPVSMDELITVADTGAVMPPKSTWFDLKPRAGFFLHDPLRLCSH